MASIPTKSRTGAGSYLLALNPGSTSCKAALFRGKKEVATFEFGPGVSLAEIAVRFKIQLAELVGVAIRIVHGGDFFTQPARLDTAAIRRIEKLVPLAPLHLPPALALIRAIRSSQPQLLIIGIFDTAFHATIPSENKILPIPKDFLPGFLNHRFGFHGIACQSALAQLRANKIKTPRRLAICHLGGGCSVSAIFADRSISNSMSLTPLAGLPMATRPGDIDPGAILLALRSGRSAAEIETMLEKKSGLMALAGESDMRIILQQVRAGNDQAQFAVDFFTARVAEFIARAAAQLGGLDAIAFTGGIGAGSAEIRARVCQQLAFLGTRIDTKKNRARPGSIRQLESAKSEIKIFAIEVDEAAEMARQAAAFLKK